MLSASLCSQVVMTLSGFHCSELSGTKIIFEQLQSSKYLEKKIENRSGFINNTYYFFMNEMV